MIGHPPRPDRLGRHRRHVMRVLDAFEPDHIAARDRHWHGPRSRRSQRHPAASVRHGSSTSTPFPPAGARRDQRTDRRDDADAGDHHARREATVPSARLHPGDLGPVVLDRLDRRFGAQVDTMRTVLVLVEARRGLRPATRASTRGRASSSGDAAAELGQHRRRFEADIAPADHHDFFAPASSSAIILSTSPRSRT